MFDDVIAVLPRSGLSDLSSLLPICGCMVWPGCVVDDWCVGVAWWCDPWSYEDDE
jgi:hypothetical protein